MSGGRPGNPAGNTTGSSARDTSPGNVVEELRALGLLALDRLEPLVVRLQAGEPVGGHACTACPVCAATTGLCGERAEAVARHAAGLITALRAVLTEAPPEPSAPSPTRVVQRIPVEREAPSC